MGIFLWLLVGACATPGAAILYAIRWLIKQEWPQLRKALYFPLAGSARWEHRTQRERLLRRFGGTELLLRTEDGRNVHCVWIGHHGSASTAIAAQGGAHASPTLSGAAAGAGGSGMTSLGTPPPCETPVVLLLHANAMVLDDMADWAHFYLSQGASVLLLTFWGYPDPSEDGDMPGEEDAADMLFGGGGRGAAEGSAAAGLCPTERSMYLDAEAALRYIQQSRRVPIENTLAHGLSIGGACAASLGYAHPGLRVTLDQTFASLHEVSLHVGAGLYDQLALSRAPRRFQPLVRCAKPLLLRLAACILLRMLFKRDAPPPPSTNQHGGASAGAHAAGYAASGAAAGAAAVLRARPLRQPSQGVAHEGRPLRDLLGARRDDAAVGLDAPARGALRPRQRGRPRAHRAAPAVRPRWPLRILRRAPGDGAQVHPVPRLERLPPPVI